MHDDNSEPNELTGDLAKIVSRITAQPVPDDLRERVRLRLDEQFNGRETRHNRSHYLALSTAILAVAAIVAVVVFRVTTAPDPSRSVAAPIEDVVSAAPSPAARAVTPSTQGPSLWAYHRAANLSLDQLDGLLAQHARLVLPSPESANRHVALSANSHSLEEF